MLSANAESTSWDVYCKDGATVAVQLMLILLVHLDWSEWEVLVDVKQANSEHLMHTAPSGRNLRRGKGKSEGL